MCEPNRIGSCRDGSDETAEDGQVAKMLPTGSTRGVRPAPPHFVEQPRARGPVGVRIGHSADARPERAAVGASERAQVLESATEPSCVDRWRFLQARTSTDRPCERKGRRGREEGAAREHLRIMRLNQRPYRACPPMTGPVPR